MKGDVNRTFIFLDIEFNKMNDGYLFFIFFYSKGFYRKNNFK